MKFKAWDKYNKCWLNLFHIFVGKDGSVISVTDLDGYMYGLHQIDLTQQLEEDKDA